ncbi:uncharacterized protein BDR25DRAFT_256989 [Lindgomyces ingoldianus]|uniref:Uncharacterized protein n=1 Tax=Lindgomyces ingoldianus TaxID=673940 RepID=A0ACB6R476_9PLEO|nr:uncharacterized protein BDR25DRAFT_256989 [Lindgomyces ingoldianus]KAF2473951.1 hypothetical protein BDR25DRAFT_256989 [Lindgomyces ingoldianus]
MESAVPIRGLLPLALFFLLLISTVAAAEQSCYGLDGTKLDSTYGPCKPGARHSGCCAIHRPAGSVDICLDNGLCMATSGVYMGTIWQDGCTDSTGKDAGCPKMCPDATNNFNGLNKVLAWNVQMCDYGSYCCRAVDDHNNCCNNSTAPKVKTTFLGAFKFATSTAGVSTATASVASAVSSPSTNEPKSVFATAVSTGIPFQASATPQSTLDAICPKDRSKVVGVAVGGVLGALLLGLLGAMFWVLKREKRQRKLKQHYEAQVQQTRAYRKTILVESDSSEVLTEMPLGVGSKYGG